MQPRLLTILLLLLAGALVNVGVENPINLLEEGRFVKEFPGFMIYIRKKNRDEVKGVVLYEMADYGVRRSIRAKRGIIQPQTDPHKISIDLYDVRMDQPDASARNELDIGEVLV